MEGNGRKGDGATHTLFYFFSPDDSRQQSRARQLEDAVRRYDRLQVIGIVREATGVSDEGLEDFRRAHGLTYELFRIVDASAKLERLPVELQRRLEASNDDYAVLVDGRQVVAEAAGEGLDTVLAAAVASGISTEIDESTWGKIKVLFQ